MTIAWVVGSGGLLGTALCRALRGDGTELFSPAGPFSWQCERDLSHQFAMAVDAFVARAGAARRWEIYWAAGVATMSSPEAVLNAEARTLSIFLNSVRSAPFLMATPGAVAFSSSAGAIYAGSLDAIISEATPPAPTTGYARAKLRQEDMVRSFVHTNRRVSGVLARLSTLYGPGQSVGKQQGLLTHVARCILKNVPVQIYVPFDTIRDYIFSDDAAARIVAALRTTIEHPGVHTAIIASEQPVTIAEIIATYKRVARRAPRVVTSASRLSRLYPHRVRFCSAVAPGNASLQKTSLLIGISQVMAAERLALMGGGR